MARRPDQFIAQSALQCQTLDANDFLYALEASSDYDPQNLLPQIKARVFALNFDDDEFNPDRLGMLQAQTRELPHCRVVVQPGTSQSFGHLTMAQPQTWAAHIAEFVRWLESDH